MTKEYTYSFKSIDFGAGLKLCYMTSQAVGHSDKIEIDNYEYLAIDRVAYVGCGPVIFFCKRIITRPELIFKSEIGTFIINLN
jgi:hypothetical protein